MKSNKKINQPEKLPNELLLMISQKTKLRNLLKNNITNDIKHIQHRYLG